MNWANREREREKQRERERERDFRYSSNVEEGVREKH